MELAGEEKRIRALFSELSREDAQNAPRFEELWREASVTVPAPRAGRLLPAVAATLIVAVTVLFVAWSRNRSPVQQNAHNAASPAIAVRPEPAAPELATPEPATPEPANKVVRRRRSSHSARRRTLARRQLREPGLEQAKMLASWKSPTENFMTAPTASAFNQLPQLNESVKDLELFLSTKESNQ